MTTISIFIILFLGLSLLRVPIAYSIMVAALAGFLMNNIRLAMIPPALLSGLDNFPLLAIPAFIFAGQLMTGGGISHSIIDFINSAMGRFRGNLGSVLVVSSMLFGSISGSSLATVTAIGGIMTPEMRNKGYSDRYIAALLSASGFLGILIPPSVPGVIYALTTGQGVTAVWMSTLLPGMVLGIAYVIINYLVIGRKQGKPTEPLKLKPFVAGIQRTIPKASVAVLMPVIIFGGVYGGVFTPTEAGVVAVFYGFLAGWIIYPLVFKMKTDMKITSNIRIATINCAAICLLIAGATLVGRLVALVGASTLLANFLMGVTESKVLFLIITNLFFLLMGMFLETNTSILIFAPLLSPIAVEYGVHPIHFGAIMLLNLEIGLITPPFAANLFVACRMTSTTINKIMKPMMPFYIVCVIVLLIVTFLPGLALWAPSFFESTGTGTIP